MKKLSLIIAILSFSAQAEVVVSGGFGTDGASGESMPIARSVKDAAEVYRALNVTPDARGRKIIGLSDESQIECSKPFMGTYRANASCGVLLRASQNGVLQWTGANVQSVTFSGKLATKIFQALPADTSGRVGSSYKKVANLSCSRVVRPGAEASCTISDVMAISLDVP